VLADTSTEDPRLGTLIDGKYRLDARIGRGGMGTIYRATHVMLEKTVAVKLINTDLGTSPEFVARFRREARAASNLDHPNIVTVHDLGQADDGALYLAMEYVDGSSLKEIIRAEGQLAPERIARLLGQVAGALSTAHRHQIIHRDLKPHNIMVATDAEGREVTKLLDFGIAKMFDDAATQLTATGAALGTPQYMSPEQAAGRDIDGRSDLYSLGIILYEMLIGEVPFSDPSTPAVLVKHLNEPPPRPSVRRPDLAVSPGLEGVALRCLEKDPGARFQTADGFAAALDRAITEPGAGRAGAVAAVVIGGDVDQDAPTADMPIPAGLARKDPPAAEAAPEGPLPAGGADLPPLSAFQNLTSAPGRQAADTPTGARSRGSTMMPMVFLLVLVGGVGLVAYFLGYFSGPDQPVADDPAAIAATAADDRQGRDPAAGEPDDTPSPATQPPAPPAESGSADRAPVTSAAPPEPVRAESAPVDPGPPQSQPEEEPLPAQPSVSLYCEGPANVCAMLGSAVDQELGRHSIRSVNDADVAEILVDAIVTESPPRVQESFGTTFVIRSFTVAFAAEARRLPDSVSMPPPTSFSYDERVGRERLTEQSRLMAAAVVQQVRAFWAEHAGGDDR
jgi:serine/threonine-protein kinase